MNAPAHLAIGLLAGLAVPAALGLPITLQSVAAAALGSLLPDADHHKTKMFKIVCLAIGIAASYLALSPFKQGLGQTNGSLAAFAFGTAAALSYAAFKPRHRGITHTLLAAVIFGAALYFASGTAVAVAGFTAYLSHLLADKQIKTF
jgi:inner membrane protein